jgi:hypothetical protein
MTRFQARKPFSVLLAALVLSVATAPPAVRHGHEGGDVPHVHGHHAAELPHEHFDAAAAHPHEAVVGGTALVHAAPGVGFAVHYHVWWLGTEWHLPALPHDGRSDGHVPLLDTCLVQLTGDIVVAPCHNPVELPTLHVHPPLREPVPAHGPRWFYSGLPPLALPPPLCDVARHERSGVRRA